ncbi:MAG TPA: TonB family protein [Longimicrobiaceae bacterium]|nr:TonB family protein [Longimicrobiaceae bacterium]
MANGTMPMPGTFGSYNANDRLKGSFNNWFWGSLAVAAVAHFALLAFWPDMQAADVSYTSEQLQQIDVIQEFEIPPPPEQIARPAVPVLSTDVNISEDITIGEVTFDENPVSDLPPPPTGQGVDVSSQPTFTPYEVRPEMTNRDEYARILTQKYPPMLRDAGIGGTVVLWVFINEQGEVQNTKVTTSSGYEALDQVAIEAMQQATFSPALNRDQRVPVWIQMPVTFQTR